MIDFSLSWDEFFYAAVLALFITWLIRTIINLKRLLRSPISEIGYPPKDIKQIIQKCYKLFPKEIINFRGEVYTRGMKIQIITVQKKQFEGELIGSNEKNMVCILTHKYIIAHEITNIAEIHLLDSQNK